MSKDFVVERLKPGQSVIMNMQHFGGQIKPTKCFILPEGAVDNKPSFVLIMVDMLGREWAAQLTLNMVLEACRAFKDDAHPVECDVDPESLTFKRDIPADGIVTICSACKVKIDYMREVLGFELDPDLEAVE